MVEASGKGFTRAMRDLEAALSGGDDVQARLQAMLQRATVAGEAPRFLTVKQAAEVLQVSSKTIYRRIEDGTLKASQSMPGAPYRIDRGKLEAYVERQSTGRSVHDIDPWRD
jgi:excisionase family DNA binding protein